MNSLNTNEKNDNKLNDNFENKDNLTEIETEDNNDNKITETDKVSNNNVKKSKNVTFSEEEKVINIQYDSKILNENSDSNNSVVENNESGETNELLELSSDEKLEGTDDINNENSNESVDNGKIDDGKIDDGKIDEGKNQENKKSEENITLDIDDLNSKQKIDDKNKDEIVKSGKRKIILKLNNNDGNNGTNDLQNNLLELEVDQLNNIEQIRFIIKIATNAQDQFIIKYGFVSKYQFYSKYHIIHVDSHVRLPSHFIEGKIRASEIKNSQNLINTQRKRHLYSMAILNSAGVLNVMDVDASSNVNHALTAKLKEKLVKYVLLEKIGFYAACSDNSIIEIFNPKFELNTFYHTEFNVFNVKYNHQKNELIAIGTHNVNIYSLDIETIDKSTQTVAILKQKLEYNTELPEEEWIRDVHLNEPLSRLYLLLKKIIIVIDINNGKEIKRTKSKSNKFITRMTSYNPFFYDIIGLADGSIQVRNTNADLLHVFNNHSNEITGLEIIPGKPGFLSSSLDGSIGLFNLVNFQEIYRLYLKEPSYGINIIDENQFLTYSERELTLWNFNNITDSFTALKSPPLSLEFSKNFNCPNRILCRTLDGGIRLISPITGEIITTAIPYIDNELIMDVLYSPALNYFYVLKYDGEIWIFSTLTNPCSVINIWKECKKENITCAKLYEDFLVPQKSLTGFSLLICGTNNGRIIFLGEYGTTKFKYMAHLKEVTSIFINTERKYIISGAKDCTINVTNVDFNLKTIIKSSITISTSFIPCLISNIHNILCVSSEDFSIHTIEFDINKKESREIINHDKMDDHSDIIRAICPINRLELFATVGQDKSLKIWDYDNCLIKEILFEDPMCAICCIENTLDLLIGVSDRIDILRSTEYLPSGAVTLVHVLNRFYSKPLEYEEPLPFSDDINILKKVIPSEAPKYYDISAFEFKKEDIFSDINLFNAFNKIVKRIGSNEEIVENDAYSSHFKKDMASYFNFTDICESLEKFNVTSVVKIEDDNELSSVFNEPDELEGFAHLRNLGLIRDSYSVLNLSEDKDIIFFNSFNDLNIMTLKKSKKKKKKAPIKKATYLKKLQSATNKILGFVKFHISLNQSLQKNEFEGSKEITIDDPMNGENNLDKQIEEETIQEQIDSAISYSQVITANALKRISNTKLNGVQDLIFIEEYQKYSKYKSFLGKEDDFETNLRKPVLYLNPSSPNQSLFMDFNQDEKEFSQTNYDLQIREFTKYVEEDVKRRTPQKKEKNETENEEENENANENEIKKAKSKMIISKVTPLPKPTIPIAPDGYIPNSIILRVIHEWRHNHPKLVVNDYGKTLKRGSEFDLIREFDIKINDINNIKNENELINDIIEKYRERKNKKKLLEMEQMKRNNIKLHTELSSFLQFSYQNNRFLNKYFNGIMPSMYNDDNEKEEEERKKKEQEEEEERRRKEEEEEEEKKRKKEEARKRAEAAKNAKKTKALPQYINPIIINNSKNNSNANNSNTNKDSMVKGTSKVKDESKPTNKKGKNKKRKNNSKENKSGSDNNLAIKYLNDEIDIQDTEKDKNEENDKENSDSDNEEENEGNEEENENENENENEEDDNEDNNINDNSNSVDEESDNNSEDKNEKNNEDDEEDGDDVNIVYNGNEDEDDDEDDDGEDEDEDDEDKEALDKMNDLIEEGKKHLYYSLEDIPEEIQKLVESFWFPKELIFKKDVDHIKKDEFKMDEECSSEKVLPKIFTIFNSEESDDLTKFDIVNYLKFYNEIKKDTDDKYCPDDIVNFLCGYLKSKWNKDLEDDDISLRLSIMDTLCEYDRKSPEFLLTLIFLLNFKNDMIKQASIHHLETLHISSILSSSLMRKIKRFYFKKKESASNSNLNSNAIGSGNKNSKISNNLQNNSNETENNIKGDNNKPSNTENENINDENENENDNDDANKNSISIYDDENYIPQPINEICDNISEVLEGLLKKFLLYLKIPSRFKEEVKNLDIYPLHIMQKKYKEFVEKEIEKELDVNPENFSYQHSCYDLETNEISEDNRYADYMPDPSNYEYNRHPLLIMTEPTTYDYVPSIIHFLKIENKYLTKKANEQKMAMEKIKKKEEEKKKELERRQLYNKFMEEREKRYKERLEQRRKRALMAAESKKSKSSLHLPSLPKNRKKYSIKSSARYGNTHCSKCHPSRETICYPLHQIPEGSICERCLRRINNIDIHFKKMYKSIPCEIIQPAPFIESSSDQMRNRVDNIQRSILDAMEKSKEKQSNKNLYSKLGRLNKFVSNYQQQSRDLLRDINLQKKRITNQILLEQQKQEKYSSIPIHKFNTSNPLNDEELDLIMPRMPTPKGATNINEQADHHLPPPSNSQYWTSKTYFIPMYSYLQSPCKDHDDTNHQHN